MKLFKVSSIAAALAASLVLGSATNAVAASKLFDFTAAPFLSGPAYQGTVDGVGFTLTFTPFDGNLTFNDGPEQAPGPIDGALFDLAGDGDGIGINNDEITNGGSGESLLITFDRSVKLSALAFLDLFLSKSGDTERAILSVDGGTPLSFIGQSVVGRAPNYGTGFAEYATDLKGTSFLFTAGLGNDNIGHGDFALAAMKVQAVPLPASVLLLGAALGGLGFMRRRTA